MYTGATAAETTVDEETYSEITSPITTTTTDGAYETADPVPTLDSNNGVYETADPVPTPGGAVGSVNLKQATPTVNDNSTDADEYLEVHDALTNVADPTVTARSTTSFGNGVDLDDGVEF